MSQDDHAADTVAKTADYAPSGSSDRPHAEADTDAPEYDTKRVEAVYRKLDWRIIPPFWVLYFLCSAIRSNIGMAQTMNASQGHDLVTVLKLTSKDISTALALFYVAYVLFDFPSNLVMTRLSPRVWMARIVFAVGVIGTCFTAVKSAWSLKFLRFLLGVVIAGMWPGMAYYLTLFYPPSRMAKRVGYYFTAAQLSASVVGLVSAGFQKMDGLGGLVGFQWMFLVYGLLAIVLGVTLLWWLPDRPLPPGESRPAPHRLLAWMPQPPEALSGDDALVHYSEMRRVYHPRPWTLRDLGLVLIDWRLWPLVMMYFGVVGVGIGTQLYGSVIIAAINSNFSSITISLLFAPIWIMDLVAILLVTPISDRFHQYRALFFSGAVLVQIAGLLVVSFATANPWARYGGMLMLGFGLGPTVPICMTWSGEIFQHRHGEVGVAAAAALVSGLGNLGSVTTTYALYSGWPADSAKTNPHRYRNSNLVMIGILVVSIASSFLNVVLLRVFGNKRVKAQAADDSHDDFMMDGAARREAAQRGLKGLVPVVRR